MREYLLVDCVNSSSKSPEKCRLSAKALSKLFLEAQVVRNFIYLFVCFLFVFFTSLYQGCNRGLFSSSIILLFTVNDYCGKSVYRHNFPEPAVTSSNDSFGPTNTQSQWLSWMTKKSSRSLHLRSWNQQMFGIFHWKNDCNNESNQVIAALMC